MFLSTSQRRGEERGLGRCDARARSTAAWRGRCCSVRAVGRAGDSEGEGMRSRRSWVEEVRRRALLAGQQRGGARAARHGCEEHGGVLCGEEMTMMFLQKAPWKNYSHLQFSHFPFSFVSFLKPVAL